MELIGLGNVCYYEAVPWWFASVWNTGAYRAVNENVGDLIDWVNAKPSFVVCILIAEIICQTLSSTILW